MGLARAGGWEILRRAMALGTHQFRIAEMVERGATLGEVEDHVISGAPIDSDEKAGLWLFAWSLLRRRARG